MTAPVAVGKLLIVLRFDFGKERLTSVRTDPRFCCREKRVQILARSSSVPTNYSGHDNLHPKQVTKTLAIR